MRHAYRLLTSIGLGAIVAALGFLVAGILLPHARAVILPGMWVSLIIVIACMELRVRMGYRTKRGPLFAAHLITAIPGFLLLTALAFFTPPEWAFPVASLLLFVAIVSGIVLFVREWRMHS